MIVGTLSINLFLYRMNKTQARVISTCSAAVFAAVVAACVVVQPAPAQSARACTAPLNADTAGLGARIAAEPDLRGYRPGDRCVWVADFDGDSRPDRADVLVRRSQPGERVIAFFPAQGPAVRIRSEHAADSVALAEPGTPYWAKHETTGEAYTVALDRIAIINRVYGEETEDCETYGWTDGGRAGFGLLRTGCTAPGPVNRRQPVAAAGVAQTAASGPEARDAAFEARYKCSGPGARAQQLIRAAFPDYRIPSDRCAWSADLDGDGRNDILALAEEPVDTDLTFVRLVTVLAAGDVAFAPHSDGGTVTVIGAGQPVPMCGQPLRFPRPVALVESAGPGGSTIREAVGWTQGSGLTTLATCGLQGTENY